MSKAIPEHPLAWMPKSVWGPLKWKELHTRALAYLPMEGEKEWFDSFVKSIPCQHCQKHFQLFVEKNPPDFTDRVAYFKWTVAAHNYVNRSNNKEEWSIVKAVADNAEFFNPQN